MEVIMAFTWRDWGKSHETSVRMIIVAQDVAFKIVLSPAIQCRQEAIIKI
jgi:hypothetical protein